MFIHLNGWPGVGKLTVARAIVARTGGRLLDNHTIANVAFSVTEFLSPAFYETDRAVRDIAYRRVRDIDPSVCVVLTNLLRQTPSSEETWSAITNLARERGSPLFAVTLDCSPEENLRRLTAPHRAEMHKLTDGAALADLRAGIALSGQDGERRLRIDATNLSAEVCADRILNWVRQPAP